MLRRCIALMTLLSAVAVEAQTVSKTVIDFCDLRQPDSCGNGGVCEQRRTGARCRCPPGWMGRQCRRPCQDVYKSCERWKAEDRCSWTRPISPFFTDNCALSCGVCQNIGPKLTLALPPMLDSIAWFVGRWETRTTAGQRYPDLVSGPYKEILDVQISEVPMFDRPPVNISVYAESMDGRDIHRELGFMTGKPFNEDTGFVEFDKPETGDDKVAIELVSNTGMMTIEEGIAQPDRIRLDTVFKRNALAPWRVFQSAKRMFKLVSPDVLEERAIYTDARGQTHRWLKRYRKTFDYLTDYINF